MVQSVGVVSQSVTGGNGVRHAPDYYSHIPAQIVGLFQQCPPVKGGGTDTNVHKKDGG
jgi:hypothetical protein